MAFKVSEIDSLEALERLAGPWRELLQRVPHDSPYLTPDFMIPWVRMLAGRYRLAMIAVHDGERLVGLAPLFERRVGQWGIDFVMRTFPLHGLSPPFDLIVDPNAAGVVDALLAHLLTRRRGDRRWHLVELLNVPADSSNIAALRAAVPRHGARFEEHPGLTTTFVPMAAGWDTYLASLPRALRKTIRQGERRLAQTAPVRVVRCPQDGMAVADGIALALDVISRSWKRFDDEAVDWPAFFRDFCARLAARDMLCLRFLMVGERAAAYHLEIAYRGNLHGLHNAYDLSMGAGAPGAVLLADAIRDAHARGCERFDFLGTKEYLERWAQASRNHVRLRIVDRRPIARVKTALYDRIARARKARAEREEEAVRLARLGRAPAVADGDAST